MTYVAPVAPADLEMHVAPGCGWAAVYQHGALVDHGDYDEVQERLIEALGVTVEHGSDAYIVTDDRGRTAPAATLDALAAEQRNIAEAKAARS